MKRRNAEIGKLRRPIKRTKITEGMYGNSMLYLRFVMLWATVVLADYMLDFRFEFLWPLWMMLRFIHESFKYQGIAFSVFFICIALTSDLICFFFIPIQYIFFAASTYVWVQYVWYTFAERGVCLPTVVICCVLVYVEGALRTERASGLELYRPLAAHCVGYPVVSLGVTVKSYVGHRLQARRQRQVRAENEFYFQLLRDALPESALEQQIPQSSKESERNTSNASASSSTNGSANASASTDARHMNGSAVKRKCGKENGVCPPDQTHLHFKLDKVEKQTQQQQTAASSHKHAYSNGSVPGAGAAVGATIDEHWKGGTKPSKLEKKESSTLKEERKKNRNKDKDKEINDSHKSTEQTKEQNIFKEIESTNNVKYKECNGNKDKEKEKEREREREKEREREHKEREKERERERERERDRERELREARECAEELKRVRCELSAARSGEAEARRALAAAAAAERQRRADHNHLKQQHASLQTKVSAWRSNERATLERRLSEERRARSAVEHQLQQARQRPVSTECESEWCMSRRAAAEAELAALRRDLQRARDLAAQLQLERAQAQEQVRSLEARVGQEEASAVAPSARLAAAWQALQEKAAHLERSLSAETRVKLDLLSALGEAKRQMHIQTGLITKQEKEIAELKAQMLAVMPSEYVTPSQGGVSKLRLSDGSPLDPNASVYTPKQLCLDA